MSRYFPLIDLRSQGPAVQQLLAGRPIEDKLTWLAQHGELVDMQTRIDEMLQTVDHGELVYTTMHDANPRRVYAFVSRFGLGCLFYLEDDRIFFVGEPEQHVVGSQNGAADEPMTDPNAKPQLKFPGPIWLWLLAAIVCSEVGKRLFSEQAVAADSTWLSRFWHHTIANIVWGLPVFVAFIAATIWVNRRRVS